MEPSQTKLASMELLGLLFGVSACVLMKIHNSQPTPYMDEIFHYRQTVKFCKMKFHEWDPMITTLPGLYTVMITILNIVSLIFDYNLLAICDLFWMRCINIVFCMGNAVLILALFKQLHPTDKEESPRSWMIVFCAFTTAVFPPLYFFTFLYYTDAGSVFFTLLMYYSSRTGFYKSSALSGLMAIFFRQTNVIWVIFVAGENLADILIKRIKPEKKELTNEDLTHFTFVTIVARSLWNDVQHVGRIKALITHVLSRCVWFIVVGVLFLAFVIWNKGIVVGDRTAHQACFHAPQFFYFFSFSAGFTIMYHLTLHKITNFIKTVLNYPVLTVVSAITILFLVRFFTYEHAYLLADNRHYTFYIWYRVFKRHYLVKYLLIPGYIYAIYTIFESLHHKNILWNIVFGICLTAVTVPQQLLEFRYFIIPFLIYRLNMKLGSVFQILLEVCLYIAVNGLTIYYFIEKTFEWPGATGKQRFMW